MINWKWVPLYGVVCLSACGEPTEYRSGDFGSLNQCMSSLQREMGEQLRIVVDEPEKVTGSQADGTFWACVKKSTGTRGIYWEGYYTIDKKKEKKGAPVQPVQNASLPVTTGPFSETQICMAGIAMMNGHPPIYDNVTAGPTEVTLRYTRSTDNKQFTYGCYLEDSEVKWRLHPNSNWSKNNQLFFAVSGNEVSIRQSWLAENVGTRSYKIGELKQ